MTITARALNRATLGRQMLLAREQADVSTAMRRVVALQAQQPASPYLALWNRLADFDPADLDAAFADHTVVKSTLIRITMHAVHADDFQPFREAMEPTLRGSRLGDPRFTSSGLTAEDADALLPDLLDFASQPRTSTECQEWLAKRLGIPLELAAWRMLRQYSPLLHAPTGPPWSFGTRQSFVAPRTRPVLAGTEAGDAGLVRLIRRYLAGFRPAHRKQVTRMNGDVLPTLLVDGYVAGVWRMTEAGLEATAFDPLPAEAWSGLAAEAGALVPFLAGREPRAYSRYDHWWGKLPGGEVRVLPG